MRDRSAQADRRFLLRLTVAGAAIGTGAAVWPLFASLAPAADTVALDEVVLDLTDLSPGSIRLATWRHRPVLVIHRTPAELNALQALPPASAEADVPWPAGRSSQRYIRTWHRAVRPEFGVFEAFCSYDFGPLSQLKQEGETAGHFFCRYCGSRFDLAGRPRGGGPARHALAVPPYRHSDPARIVIGGAGPFGV